MLTSMNGEQIKTEAEANSPHGSLAMRCLRFAWDRRQHAAITIYMIGNALGWVYDKFPLPRRVKDITTELTYHAIEHFVVQSQGYQNWLHRRSGLTRLHGLFQSDEEEVTATVSAPKAPSDDEWNDLIENYKGSDEVDKAIAIIIPVYKGYDESLTSIYSVLKANVETPYTLTVINDASPEPDLANKLKQLAHSQLFELIVHDKNQGFVRTANEGMKHHNKQDVVLLNADTEVYEGWLDRLKDVAYRGKQTATVTPFSNHAELCSYPRAFHSNRQALELSYRELDQLASYSNHDYTPALPTAVGFCMLIRREALDQVGYFDEEAFGRGYGEENDWCLRATDKGWRHVLAGNVFVRHTGSVSFAGHKSRQLKRALHKLNKRHPHYRDLVRSFKDEDPLLQYRQQLDLSRLHYLSGGNTMLMVTHNAGGGTERHVQEMTKLLANEGVTAYRLTPDPRHASKLRLWHEDAPYCPNLIFDIDHDFDELSDCLKSLGISHIHLHHLSGFPQRMSRLLAKLARELRVPYDVTAHDYYFICPSINLTYDSGMYESDPSIDVSDEWASRNPTPADRTPIWEWRERHNTLLKEARRVFAPSEDCARRIQRYFPEVSIFVRPHPEKEGDAPNLYLKHRAGTTIHVAVIGRLSNHKGLQVILGMARDAKERRLPIHFHVIGDADQASALRKTEHVTIHGAYQEDDVYSLLEKAQCHVAFFSSIWPETYSYTLSIALNAHLYPVSFNLGAPSERIQNVQWGEVLPYELAHNPAALNDALIALETETPPADLDQNIYEHYRNLVNQYYGGLTIGSERGTVDDQTSSSEILKFKSRS